jgi:inner membrane protein COX18
MFARKHVARLTTFRPFPPTQAGVGTLGKRQFTSAIQNGFLDLAIALPWPTSFPPYSSTIILLTVVSRLALTVPFSVWVSLMQTCYTGRQPHRMQAKKRQRRLEKLVIPRLRETRPLVEKQVVHEMRVKRVGGTKEERHRVFGERVRKIVRLCLHSCFEIIRLSSYYFLPETRCSHDAENFLPNTAVVHG